MNRKKHLFDQKGAAAWETDSFATYTVLHRDWGEVGGRPSQRKSRPGVQLVYFMGMSYQIMRFWLAQAVGRRRDQALQG